jgi:acyl-CoA thioesterase
MTDEHRTSTDDPGAAQQLAEQATLALYEGDEATQALGIQIVDVSPGRAVARMTVTESMINGVNLAHGGYLFLLADTALAFAAQTRGRPIVSAHAHITFIAPARACDALSAIAEERTWYGRSAVYDIAVRNQDDLLIAEMRGHVRALRDPVEAPANGTAGAAADGPR